MAPLSACVFIASVGGPRARPKLRSLHLLRLCGAGFREAVLSLGDRGLAVARFDEFFLKFCLLVSREGGHFAFGRQIFHRQVSMCCPWYRSLGPCVHYR